MKQKYRASERSESEEREEESDQNQNQPSGDYLDLSDEYVASSSTMGPGEKFEKSNSVADGVKHLPKDQGFTRARTTFPAEESKSEEHRYNRLWRIQHGTNAWSGMSPVDEVERGHRFDPAERDKWLNVAPVLDLVPPSRRSAVRRRVQDYAQNRFNSWYFGIYGATIGACIVEMYDSVDSFISSKRDRLYQQAQEYWESLADHPDNKRNYTTDVESLAELAFDEWADW